MAPFGSVFVYSLTLLPVGIFIAITSAVLAFPTRRRLLNGQDKVMHRLLTGAVALNLTLLDHRIPSEPIVVVSALFVISALTMPYVGFHVNYNAVWKLWYQIIGVSGMLVGIGATVCLKLAALFDEFADYENQLLFKIIALTGVLSHTSFSLYVLHSSRISVRLEEFYGEYSPKWLHEQGRDFFFVGSSLLLLSVISKSVLSDFILCTLACLSFWLSFSLNGFSRDLDQEIIPWLGFVTAYISTTMQLLLSQVDPGKTYSFFITIRFLSMLFNSLVGLALAFLSVMHISKQRKLFVGFTEKQLLLPGRIGMAVSSLSLLLGAHPRFKGTSKQFLTLSVFGNISALFSLFIFYGRKDPRLVLYQRQDYNHGRNADLGVNLIIVLWITFTTSFVSTFCYYFVHVQVEKERAPELVAGVKAMSEVLNIVSGGLSFVFSVFVENLYGETVQLGVYFLIQIIIDGQ